MVAGAMHPGCRLCRRSWVRDDGDGAGGVVQDGLADRAEQQSGEAAAATGADHDELGRLARLYERLAGAGMGPVAADGDVSVLVVPASEASASTRASSASTSATSCTGGSRSPGPMETGWVQACSATSGTPRSAASSNANPTARSFAGEPSTPSSTGAAGSAVPRATRTWQVACAASFTATEPISGPVSPPRPRSPTTRPGRRCGRRRAGPRRPRL